MSYILTTQNKEIIMNAAEFDLKIQNLSQFLKPFALKLTRDSEGADDLLQETFLKAISNREKYKDGTNLKAWLYTIMKNTFITEYHRNARRNTFIDTTDNMHFINSSGSVTQNQAVADFVMEDASAEIDKLKVEYKEPFLMHFRGFKYHEIAEYLDIPIGTVKNRIHIARKELKRKLKVYGTSN